MFKVISVLIELHLAEISNMNGYVRVIIAIIHNEFQFEIHILT